jgi:glutamyl-tRNA reductase
MSRGIQELIICNRTYERALEMAENFSATAIPFDKISDHLKHVDIVVTSTAAPDFIIDKKMVRKLMPERLNRPLFFIDISMPRNVEASVNNLENVYLYNMEDLKSLVSENLDERKVEMVKAKAIIEEEVVQCLKLLQQRKFDSTIGDLKRSLEFIVQQEIARVSQKLQHRLSREELELFDKLAESLVSSLMHHPARFLRDHQEVSEEAVRLVRKTFGFND